MTQKFYGPIIEGQTIQAVSLNYGSELVVNGDMELDSNWSSVNTPVVNERSTTQVHSGTYSRKIQSDASYDGIISDTFNLVAGHVYKVTGWIYGDGTASVSFAVFGAGNIYWSPLGVGAGYWFPASWTEQTWIFIAIASETANIYSREGGVHSSGTWYLDDVSVKELPLVINGDAYLTGNIRIVIPTYANNAAAVAGGLVAGQIYRVNAATDPEPLYIVH
jgi:hypothetical protein